LRENVKKFLQLAHPAELEEWQRTHNETIRFSTLSLIDDVIIKLNADYEKKKQRTN